MTQPDFIVIPTHLLSDDALQPSDRILFGYIYWMTKMALMKCVASNSTFMELTGMSERTISLALHRLERQGYVRIIYKDESRRHRLEIIPLIAFSAINPHVEESRPHKRAIQTAQNYGLDRTNVLQNKKYINRKDNNNSTNVELAKPPEKAASAEINEAFEYWNQVIGYPIVSHKRSNRYACANLIKRYKITGVRKLIELVNMAHGDRYAGSAGKISDFAQLQARQSDLNVWIKAKASERPKGRIHEV